MTPDTPSRTRSFPRLFLLLVLVTGLTVGCRSSNGNADHQQSTGDLDVETLRQTLEMEGTVQEGRFKVTIPQNDLGVTVDGVDIIPPMGMGSFPRRG